MKRWIVLAMLLVPLVASADDFWDGNAALQRGDADFESGLNVASNSFPPGTQITIQDQDTGKTVTATVTGRIEGQSDILLLMSPKTAAALGVTQGTLGRVRVTEPARPDTMAALPSDQTVSRDPDLNPAASAATAETTQLAEAPQSAAEAPAAAPAAEAPAETPAEQPGATAQAAPNAQSDDAAILSQAESRNPQKEMFQPPREDEKFSYHPESVPTQTGTTPAQAATIASVSEPAVTPPSQPESNLPLADVVAPEESRPEEIVGTSAAVPAPAPAPQEALAAPEVAPAGQTAVAQAPVQTEVTGPPAAPPAAGPAPKVALAPPEAPASQKAKPTAATTPPGPAAATVVSATSVPKSGPGTFYLQLAAYGSEKGARELAAKLAPTYPALVLAPSGAGRSIFKVVIGPLNKAESGTLLVWFRYRGFPDAFLKQE